jgi:hypothetical protein
MSKSTAAAILVSPARVGPWGDPTWRFSGAMQVVYDGPDWLYARWPVLNGEPDHDEVRFASMVLQDPPSQRADDIAVMALALAQAPDWQDLRGWWGPVEGRAALQPRLMEFLTDRAADLKLAVVDTWEGGFDPAVMEKLDERGFEVVHFVPAG